MKVIFIDFDGVITTQKSMSKLDPEKLELLGEILDATGAYLVISSTWRERDLEATKKYLSTKYDYTNEEVKSSWEEKINYLDEYIKAANINFDLTPYRDLYKTFCE